MSVKGLWLQIAGDEVVGGCYAFGDFTPGLWQRNWDKARLPPPAFAAPLQTGWGTRGEDKGPFLLLGGGVEGVSALPCEGDAPESRRRVWGRWMQVSPTAELADDNGGPGGGGGAAGTVLCPAGWVAGGTEVMGQEQGGLGLREEGEVKCPGESGEQWWGRAWVMLLRSWIRTFPFSPSTTLGL